MAALQLPVEPSLLLLLQFGAALTCEMETSGEVCGFLLLAAGSQAAPAVAGRVVWIRILCLGLV